MAKRAPSIEAAQALLLKANAADPNDPLAFEYFYESYAAQGKAADADGLTALAMVVELVPQVPSPRLMLAQEYMRRSRWLEARATLRPLAYSPHDSGAARLARELLDTVNARLGEY